MRHVALALLLFAACGKDSNTKVDGGPLKDATIDSPVDAGPLAACANPVSGTTIKLRKIGTVTGGAMLATSPPNDPRLFVVEQGGAIRIFENETLLGPAFIDLSDNVGGPVLAGGEQGLLGLAFHPQYATNGTFFVYYTRRQSGDTTNPTRDVVARCQRSVADPNKADPTCVEVLAIPDFASNHNGGMIEFGKDGFLYIGTGDGGQANDPNNNGQALTDGSPNANTHALLGKLLRIDVDNKLAGQEYGIPSDNPFAAGGGLPEIFAIGLRNPWRWSFDRLTGDMWIGDVGQEDIEEVDVIKAGELKGKNFGWSTCEGSKNFKPAGAQCTIAQFAPQDERTHTSPPNGDGWNAIIGGQVYRGTCYPDIVGTYFYTDNGRGGLAKATLNGDGSLTKANLPGSFPASPASLHEDARGELYLTDTAGNVHHLEASP
ncbi:MAG: Glucose/sorbosone dehydrogenase-like protein [Deltaproteobacteria bacterium]|nr:Glucose/sorbosone dehydrogenase-like protein [Deltaproteobacteria bacterium]